MATQATEQQASKARARVGSAVSAIRADMRADMIGRRDLVTATELLDRARIAARYVLGGLAERETDREDCASEILTRGLGDCYGSLPTRRDPRQTVEAYIGRAMNWRRDTQLERARMRADDERARADAPAPAPPDYAQQVARTVGAAYSPAHARKVAMRAFARLGGNLDVYRYLYRLAREVGAQSPNIGAEVSRELEVTATGLDMSCSRARKDLAANYSDAGALLARLVDCAPIILARDTATGELELRFTLGDDSTDAQHRSSRSMAKDWRTRAGEDAPVKLARTRGRRKSRRTIGEDAQALTRQARANMANMRARNGDTAGERARRRAR